jgi:hypothetical protein
VGPTCTVEKAEWGLPALLRRQSGAYLHCCGGGVGPTCAVEEAEWPAYPVEEARRSGLPNC